VRHFKYVLVALVGLLAVYLVAATVTQFRPGVLVKPHPDVKETSYAIVDEDGGEISLTTYQTELNKGVLRLRSTSEQPLEVQINMLDRIIGRVLRDEKREGFKTLSIGRLVNAFGKNNTQMSERLSMAAYRSSAWNNYSGRPVSGHVNDLVVKLANNAKIYSELKQLFEKYGFSIRFSSAEKVLVSPKNKLPYDCLSWFNIAGVDR